MRKTIFFGLLIFLSMSVMSVWGWENKAANEMLLEAVKTGNMSLFDKAIEEGASVNYVDIERKSVFMHACESQNDLIVQKMLGMGVHYSYKNHLGQNALMLTVQKCRNNLILNMLLDTERVNINDFDINGKTVLMYAVENQSDFAVNTLLKKRVDTRPVDVLGEYDAFHWAVECKNENAVKAIMDKSNGINWSQTRQSNGNNAFMTACENESLSIVRYMLTGNNAFDLNTRVQNGQPILLWLIDKKKSNTIIKYIMEFCEGGYEEICGYKDDFDKDIYYYARKRENSTVLKKLDEMEEKEQKAQQEAAEKAAEREARRRK